MSTEENNLTPKHQAELDKLKDKIAFQQKIVAELRSNPNIQEFFEDYTPASVESFINTYAFFKSNWYDHGEFLTGLQEKHELKWIEGAWWHLKMIQQKKLFDLQCQWRAEQIELPGVELCCDFGYWQKNIMNCPFVPDITEDEIDLYQEYMQSDDVQLQDEMQMFLSLQSYEHLKEAHQNEGEAQYDIPEWYSFYNSRKGTGFYLDLPNIRGEKESFYLSLARTPEQKQGLAEVYNAIFNPPETPVDKEGRKYLSPFDPEQVDPFVEKFEDKQTKAFYKADRWFNRHREEHERLNEAIELLYDAGEDWPIDDNANWQDAIYEAARKYTIGQICEHLPQAYAEYRMNKSMNISSPNDNDYFKDLKAGLVKEILEGRRLNGEPEDLNF